MVKKVELTKDRCELCSDFVTFALPKVQQNVKKYQLIHSCSLRAPQRIAFALIVLLSYVLLKMARRKEIPWSIKGMEDVAANSCQRQCHFQLRGCLTPSSYSCPWCIAAASILPIGRHIWGGTMLAIRILSYRNWLFGLMHGCLTPSSYCPWCMAAASILPIGQHIWGGTMLAIRILPCRNWLLGLMHGKVKQNLVWCLEKLSKKSARPCIKQQVLDGFMYTTEPSIVVWANYNGWLIGIQKAIQQQVDRMEHYRQWESKRMDTQQRIMEALCDRGCQQNAAHIHLLCMWCWPARGSHWYLRFASWG